jgi:hypothetical protein
MIQGDTRKRVDLSTDDELDDDAQPKRTVLLGELKTDEEARLAREIELLRASPPKGERQ